jgi:cholesterol oxidase
MTPSTVRFTEEMLGHVTFGETDFARGAQPQRDGSAAFKFHLTLEVEDIDDFRTNPLRPAGATGYVQCDALGGRLPVVKGWFNLFVDVEPGVKHMLYRLWFYDSVGHPLTMTGFKLVTNDAGFDVWKDTTTLFTRVLRGHVAETDPDGDIVASGIIIIRARDFAKQLTTSRSTSPSPVQGVKALVQFGVVFVKQLAEAYLRRRPRKRVAA